MKIYTICEFIYLKFPYAQTGIQIISHENIYVFNNDYTYFLEICSNLASVSYTEGGEELYKYDHTTSLEVFFNNGIYKDYVANKYYIISCIE